MCKNRKPFFSIVTISFNQEKFINECINSVLNQSFEDFEYIIQDPGSNDKSREIISLYKNDPRLRICFEKDCSPSDGLNKGFSKANGHYFLFINSDDELCDNGLQNIYDEITKNPGFDVYSGSARIIDKKGKFLRLTFSDKMNIRRAIHGQCILVQPSTVFKSSLFNTIGGFNKNNLVNWDGELFIDFAISSAKFKVFKKAISNFRITSESITGSGKFKRKIYIEQKKIYKKVYKKKPSKFFNLFTLIYRFERKVLNIEDTFQRIIGGKISGRSFD